MANPSPEQLREKAGLQSKGFKLTIPSPQELRNKLSGAFSVPKAQASTTKYPSPQQLRASVAAPSVSQETEAPVLDPKMVNILRINQTKPAQRELKDIPTELRAAPKPTTKQKIVNFFRTTPVLKDITEGLFGIPEAERDAFEPRSSISDSMSFEQFLSSEEAKKTLEKANEKTTKARGTPLSEAEQEDVLDFKYNQEEQERKIANQGILGFMYENLLKTDNRKIEDRYNKLRLAGVPEDRATQVAVQDVFDSSKNFNEQVKESLAKKIAEENGVAYNPEGRVTITPEEASILKAEGFKEKAMQGLESLDFLGVGSIIRKGGTTIGKPALRELEKIAAREGILDFFKNLFSKVDDVPPELIDDLADAVYDVQKTGINKLGGTQTQIDEAIARVLKDSGKTSLVTKKAGEEVIKLQNIVTDSARSGNEVASFADEISDIAENSLKRDTTGAREASIKALRADPQAGAKGEIRLRQLDDGRVVIEDGRHRLDLARETGILPRIVDVSQNYDPKIVSDKVQDLIKRYDSLAPDGGKLADNTAIGAKFAGDDAVKVASRQEPDFLLPKDISVTQEAKAVGAKRIAPDRVVHQKLTPEEGIEALVEDAAKQNNRRSSGFASASERLAKIQAKYGDKLPARTKSNLTKYPDLADDYRIWEGFKRYSSNGSIADALARFQRFSKAPEMTPEQISKIRASATKAYIEAIKKDISKGYRYPDAVLNYDPSFKKAVDARARYEKGLATSFSADDSRIVFDEKGRISAGMKRQDGKELLPKQREEIVNGVLETQKALGIDLNDLAKDERWVYVHLNDKNPFLTQNAAGLYRKDPTNKSVSISLGGSESFDAVVDGEKVRKRINTTVAHELGHALDYQTGNKLIDSSLVYDLSRTFKPVEHGFRGNKYWRSTTEVKARAVEQYVAVKAGNADYFTREGYWSKEIFESKIKPAIEGAVDTHFSQYKKAASELAAPADTTRKIVEKGSKKIGMMDSHPSYTPNMNALIKQAQDAGETFPYTKMTPEEQKIVDDAFKQTINDIPVKIPEGFKAYEPTVTSETVDVKKLEDLRYFQKVYESAFAVGGDKKLYDIMRKKLVPEGREASGFLADLYKKSKAMQKDLGIPEIKPVLKKKEVGTAPARRADDLRTALTNPKRVAEEANETQRKISGTEPDGVLTAAKIGQAKEIPATPAKASRYATKADAPIEIPDETRMGYLQRKIQDKFNRLNLIQKKITDAKGLPISDDLNAYLQQEMFHGRAAERLDKFEAAIVSTKGQKGKALLEKMADDGISIDEMGEFLHAKHAPARNRRVAKINPDIPDGGSGLTFKQADEIIEKYRGSGKLEKMEEYAKEVYEKITKARLKILEEEHLMKPESVDNIARAFDDDTYVPLKLPVEPEFRLRGGAGFDVRGKDVKRLKGSTQAIRNNPLIQAIVDYEDAVIKAEKNKVGRSLKKLIEQNPNITNQQGQKIWDVAAQKYAPVYNKFGEVEFIKPAGYKLADNVMEVRDKGQIFHITMHDKALASAMRNLGSERGIQFLHQINNYLRAVTTFYNPEFMITNFERDIQSALINTAGEQGVKHSKNVAKNVPSALRGIWRETRGKGSKVGIKEGGIDWVQEYAELKATGGRMGWFDAATLAEKQVQIQKRINRVSGKGTLDKAARTWDGVAEWVSDVNESVESGVRLSAYVNAKKAGMTKEQAASLAKNLTVNFNKKGEWGSAVNSLYLFANAGIQGTARMFKALKHKRTRRIVAGVAAFSYGVNYMNDQINGEAYAKIDDYEKNTNLIFMLPAGANAPDIDAKFGSVETIPNTNEKYIKLKLPYGYNVFKVMGDVSYEMSLGKKRIGDSLKRLLFAMDESFNPLSSGSAAQLVSPTISDPLVQMYENKNFFGGKIKPDQEPYGAEKKQSDLYFSTVRQPTKLFTKWLNDVSGGNEVEAGLLDLSPENVDHIIDFLGGGVSKFFANTIDTGVSLAQGDLPEAENTPFVRKFVGDVYDDVERSIYYDLLNKSETRLLNEQEVADLKKYGKQALEEGSITKETAKKTVTSMLTNQNKIHAGRIFEKIKDAPKEERKAIYDEYLKANELEKRDKDIQKQLKEVISGYKTSREDPDKRGFAGTLLDGGKGLFVDPQNVLKAMFTEEKLGKVEGNLVELERFYGTQFNEAGGSQEKKRSMMQAQGLKWDDAESYKLEHITPVKAGGDTSDDNLRIVSNEEHDSYTPVDIAVAAAVQAGKMTRKEASDLMERMKIEKSITPQEAFEEVKAKAR